MVIFRTGVARTQRQTLGFFFLPAPGTFVLRVGFGLSIEEPPLRPLQQGRVAVTKSLRTPALPLILFCGPESSQSVKAMGVCDDVKQRGSRRNATAIMCVRSGVLLLMSLRCDSCWTLRLHTGLSPSVLGWMEERAGMQVPHAFGKTLSSMPPARPEIECRPRQDSLSSFAEACRTPASSFAPRGPSPSSIPCSGCLLGQDLGLDVPGELTTCRLQLAGLPCWEGACSLPLGSPSARAFKIDVALLSIQRDPRHICAGQVLSPRLSFEPRGLSCHLIKRFFAG